jgi:hypothetical protein
MRESETVRVRLPGGHDGRALLARDGDREYLWLGAGEDVAAGDEIRVEGEPARVAQAARREHGGRPTTVARIQRLASRGAASGPDRTGSPAPA